MLAKHDENYMPPEVAEALKRSGRWQEKAAGGQGTMIAEARPFRAVLALRARWRRRVVPLVGAARGDARLMEFARAAALAQFGFVAIAFGCLDVGLRRLRLLGGARGAEFASAKPLLYKLTGVWGNHEGSMLLWVLILALFGAAVARVRRQPAAGAAGARARGAGDDRRRVPAFILFTSNPFARLFPPPADGNGLNPLLQDPGLAFHPPLLYLGYVGFSIVFCLRGRGADRGAGRRGLGALGAAVDAGGVVAR